MRRLRWLFAATLVVSSLPALADTSPRFGSVCSKQGITKTYNGKKFTCVKSGVKLLWDKGIAVKTPQPAPTVTVTATPQPAPTVTVTATPQPAPTVTVTATPQATWSDGYTKLNLENFDKYSRLALSRTWNAFVKMKSGVPPKNTQRTILIGPNSNPGPNYDFERMLTNYEAFFSWADIPEKYSFMYLRCDDQKNDIDWAKTEFRRIYGFQDVALDRYSTGTKWCGFGYASSPNSTSEHILLAGTTLPGVVESNCCDPKDYVLVHEFTHIVQANQRKKETRYSVPTWLIEGGAVFFGLGASATSFEQYKAYRQDQADNPHVTYASIMKNIKIDSPRNARKKFVLTDQEIQTWLLDDKSAPHAAAYGEWNYSLGSIANEAIAAVYGAESLMRLIGNVKVSGLKEGFKTTYNEDFDSFLPFLVKAIKILLYMD